MEVGREVQEPWPRSSPHAALVGLGGLCSFQVRGEGRRKWTRVTITMTTTDPPGPGSGRGVGGAGTGALLTVSSLS